MTFIYYEIVLNPNMVMLTTEDRNELVDHIRGKAFLLRPQILEGIFRRAGLKDLLAMIDLSGTPASVLDNIISFLEDYGKMDPEHEALGLFLITMKDNVGWEVKEFIDKLVVKYNLTPTPDKSTKEIAAGIAASHDSLSAVNKNLRIINRLSGQMNNIEGDSAGESKAKRSPVRVPKAEQRDNEVIIIQEGQERTRITSDMLNQLSAQEVELITALEKSMENRFHVWVEVYPLLALTNDPLRETQLRFQLKDIAKEMCSDLNRIMNLMKIKGIDITGHYQQILSICQDL